MEENHLLLFELRGRSKDNIVASLRERRVQGVEATNEAPYAPDDMIETVETVGLEQCWTGTGRWVLRWRRLC